MSTRPPMLTSIPFVKNFRCWYAKIDRHIEYGRDSLCRMERPCTGKRSTPPGSIRTDGLVDIGLQFICGYMAKHQRCRIICRYLLISSPMLKIIQIHFQVFDGQSGFIDYSLTLTSASTNFGMSVDNLGFDTNNVLSSR